MFNRRAAVLLAAVAAALMIAPSAAQAAPPTPAFGPAIDAYAAYDGQNTCDPTAKPGVVGFRDLLNRTYGTHTSGISRACDSGGTSEHKEGRALDYHFNYGNPAQRADAADLLAWLLATDRYGNRHAMARRLGMMYIIWNHQIWEAYRPGAGWQAYTGPNPHTDHIHFSFSWRGARKQTTWWTAARPAMHDFNGDGDADVLARHASSADLHLYRGNGSSGFDGSVVIGNNWSAFDTVFSPGDFSGDGRMDVLARHATTKDLFMYRGNGSVGFSSSVMVGNNWGAFDMIFSPGDFSGDGKADVIARNASTKDLVLYRGDGTTGFSSNVVIGNNWGAFNAIFSPGDFSGDGKADLIARNASTNELVLYRGNGSNGFLAGSTVIGHGWGGFDMLLSVGDFSGDGNADVVARHATTKDLHLYRGDGAGHFQAGNTVVGNNWGAFNAIF
ncbi:MAG TPA: VCBS repeat-containing protein [Candidatus Limnocylindrales bacterium]